jgi:uncharacterized surface protein with fasciclin (FAS1) repeats
LYLSSKIIIMKKIVFLFISIVLFSCTKDDGPKVAPIPPGYGNRIQFVMRDNLDLQFADMATQYCGFSDTLSGDGEYTFLTPNTTAFANRGLFNRGSILYTFVYDFTIPQMLDMMRYCTLRGKVSFVQMPVGTDTALLTLDGGYVHVKKYVGGGDTVTTVNGATLVNLDVPASNGYLEVWNMMSDPEQYSTVTDLIHNDPELTIFSAALGHSGLDVQLAGKDAYTVIAPTNVTLQASARFTTIDTVLKTDPAELKGWLQHYILKGRYFTPDMFRAGSITMEDGQQIAIGGYAAYYNTITFDGAGIYKVWGGKASINNADKPAGNGVLFKINAVLN